MGLLRHKHARLVLWACTLVCGTILLLIWLPLHSARAPIVAQLFREEANDASVSEVLPTACIGPRRVLLNGSTAEDRLRFATQLKNTSFPIPTIGSYDALGLEQTWMTIEQRYGPYGYGEEENSYNYSRVLWEATDWGYLQTECLEANKARFTKAARTNVTNPRFRFVGQGQAPKPLIVKTGRQAIVLRTWSTYKYHPEDLWNIRSTINEASLATGAEYQVFLLVDYKCDERDSCSAVHQNDAYYNEILDDAVPKEFRHMAVLFHQSLLEDWYSQTLEHRSFWQIMQPLQLFAHFYPEFDHYWQIEMDTRFTGDAGKMLRAFSEFGKTQPYKQAIERASWAFMPRVHHTYENFAKEIDTVVEGKATVWGPLNTEMIDPIGPEPPVADPAQDLFKWGVGRDADLLLLGQLNDINRIERHDDWIFKEWYYGGFEKDVPRFMSVPAQARASYDLLEAIHRAQNEKGLRVPSEATLPSFALWHGLKVVGVPSPKWLFPERDMWELNQVLNGGMPKDFHDGFANGPGVYRAGAVNFFSRPLTFDWWSSLCDPMFDRWMKLPYKEKGKENEPHNPMYVPVPNEMPSFMAEVDGEVYMPNLMVHPRKSNSYRAPE